VVAGSVAALVALVAAFFLPIGSNDHSDILRPPVTIGVTTDSPGLDWQHPATGKYSGFDVAIYEWIATHSDQRFTPQVIEVAVSEREKALVRGGDAGGADLIVATYSITGKREQQVDFAGPYLETRQGVMVRAVDPRTITNPSQLAGRSVCSERGSTSARELEQITGVIRVEGDTLLRCVQKLKAREVDAVSTDSIVLHGYARKEPQLLRVENGVTFGAIQEWGIGLSPEDGTASCELVTSRIE